MIGMESQQIGVGERMWYQFPAIRNGLVKRPQQKERDNKVGVRAIKSNAVGIK